MTANDYLVGIHWHDAIIVGAGHDGLACAAVLARRGLKVIVLEATAALGGSARTERPFAAVPELATPVGACSHGVVAPAVIAELGLELPTMRRDPHTVVATLGGGHLALGGDASASRAALEGFAAGSRAVAAIARAPSFDARCAGVAIRGGMGTASRVLADLAIKHGAIVETEAPVSAVVVEHGVARGVVLKDGTAHHATAIVCNADPIAMRDLVGAERLAGDYGARIDALPREAVTRASVALRALPRLACWPDAFAQPAFGPAIFLAPSADDEAAIELTVSTALDPSLRDPGGHHDAAIVARGERTLDELLAIVERHAPGVRALVVGAVVRHERDVWSDGAPLPIATPIAGLYVCSAATRPAGAVVGAAGLDAAAQVMKHLGKG